MKTIWICLILLMSNAAIAETNALCGVWTTGPVLGQLGMVVTEKEFRTNGTVSTRVQFLSMTNVPPMVLTGTYSTEGNTLTTIIRGGTSEWVFICDGDTLEMTGHNSEKVSLKRKQNPEPAGGAYVSPAAGDPSAHP